MWIKVDALKALTGALDGFISHVELGMLKEPPFKEVFFIILKETNFTKCGSEEEKLKKYFKGS